MGLEPVFELLAKVDGLMGILTLVFSIIFPWVGAILQIVNGYQHQVQTNSYIGIGVLVGLLLFWVPLLGQILVIAAYATGIFFGVCTFLKSRE